MGFCNIANQHCREERTRASCYCCGEAACGAPGCSIVTTYPGHGRRRLCMSCLEQFTVCETPPAWALRALRRLYMEQVKAAGYGPAVQKSYADLWLGIVLPQSNQPALA